MSRRSATVLAATSTAVMRAECRIGSSTTIKSFYQAERPEGTPLTVAAELAVSLNKAKPSQRTILLADDFWAGTIDLDERSIYGLEGDELSQMLRFETESLSALDPMSSHLAAVELTPVPPDTRRFWCVGVEGEVLASIATMISLRGGKLVYLTHPMGICGPAGHARWVEFHRNLSGAFAPADQGFPRAAIAPRSKTSDRWYRSLETSFGADLPVDGWITSGADPVDAFPGSLQTFDRDEVVQSWLGTALERLISEGGIPTVAPPVRPTSTRTLARVGAAAALLFAVVCTLHFFSVSLIRSSLHRQIVALQEPAEEKKALDEQVRQLDEQVNELETELHTLQAQESNLSSLTKRTDRFSQLLRIVARAWDENLVVDRIETNSTGMQLAGRAISSDSASRLAMRLSPETEQLGWRVEAPVLEGENKMVNGGPWKFRIGLVDISWPPDNGKRERSESVAKLR